MLVLYCFDISGPPVCVKFVCSCQSTLQMQSNKIYDTDPGLLQLRSYLQIQLEMEKFYFYFCYWIEVRWGEQQEVSEIS